MTSNKPRSVHFDFMYNAICAWLVHMSMSWHGDTFHITGTLAGEPLIMVDSLHRWPSMPSFVVFFDVSLNKLLRKQPSCWWFYVPWSSYIKHHCNVCCRPWPTTAAKMEGMSIRWPLIVQLSLCSTEPLERSLNNGPFYWHGLTVFLTFQTTRYTSEVWEWMNNFIPYYLMDIITFPCWD